MSIYTEKQVKEAVEKLNDRQAKALLVKLVSRPLGAGLRSRLYRLIMGIDENKGKELILVAPDRAIPLSTINALSKSPLMEYVNEIIQAALDSRGPFQTNDILLLASELKGGKAFYITRLGISQNIKNHAGHILSIAGFDRASHYDRERKMPLKAWKQRQGYKGMSVDMLANEVYATIGQHALTEEPPKKNKTSKPKPPSLKDFL